MGMASGRKPTGRINLKENYSNMKLTKSKASSKNQSKAGVQKEQLQSFETNKSGQDKKWVNAHMYNASKNKLKETTIHPSTIQGSTPRQIEQKTM